MIVSEIPARTFRATSSISIWLWVMFAICLLGNVMAGSVSTLMSVYLPVIVSDLLGTVNDARLSEVSSLINALYIAGWTLGGFTWGIIADRIAGQGRSPLQ